MDDKPGIDPVFFESQGAARPRWASVIGWISIGLAAFYIGVIVLSAARWMPAPGTPEHRNAVATITLGVSLMAVLGLGGYLLLRRRRIARRLHLLYAWTVLLAVIFQLVLLTRAPLHLPPAQIAAALFQAAYPLFLVYWFGRPKIRAQMAAWAS